MNRFALSAVLFAGSILAAPAVSAQDGPIAAGTLPNTFDRPAATRAPAAATPTPAEVSSTPANTQSESAIRAFIAGAQGSGLDYSVMTDDLATRFRDHADELTGLVRGFGALQSITFVGSQNGADLYGVVFANAATQWVIGYDETGKIAALLFRPAPQRPAGAAPAPTQGQQPPAQ